MVESTGFSFIFHTYLNGIVVFVRLIIERLFVVVMAGLKNTSVHSYVDCDICHDCFMNNSFQNKTLVEGKCY